MIFHTLSKTALLAAVAFSIPYKTQDRIKSFPIRINQSGHIIAEIDIVIGKRILKQKRALIDFGAGGSIIDASLINSGESHSYRAEIEDATGEKRAYTKAAWFRADLGLSTSAPSRAIIMDLHSKTRGRADEIDLILGSDIFHQNRIGFDLMAGRLLDLPIEVPDVDLPIEWTSDHLPAVSGQFNGSTVKWILDTGSKFPLSIPKSMSPKAVQLAGPLSAVTGINGKLVSVESTLQNVVKLGDHIWIYQTAWLTPDTDATLGTRFFDNCQVEFDFINNRFKVRRLKNADS